MDFIFSLIFACMTSGSGAEKIHNIGRPSPWGATVVPSNRARDCSRPNMCECLPPHAFAPKSAPEVSDDRTGLLFLLLDVLVIGAGVSGIGMACQLAMKCPGKRVAILERRDAIGGTWDLFRYPGVRSDLDFLTYGFSFRPWTGTAVFADGPSIKGYY